MIDCKTCAGIIDSYIQTEADRLFSSSVRMPNAIHGCSLPCEECGRRWTISMHTLDYEGDLIPEGAVLTEVDNAKELTDLELREAMDAFDESFDKWEKGIDEQD